MSFRDELDQERERVVRLVQHAGAGWAEAIRAHRLAPPDEGFAARLQRLSEAAAAEQLAWQQAHEAGLQWQPVRGSDGAEPPYELRPGTGRRGPADLWLQFDGAVAAMNHAIGGASAVVVSAAFGGLAEAASKLAAAVAGEDRINREAKELARTRDAA
ncbi:MAG: hypothetical protein M0T77_12830 [Actinomycetota bacterium]|nr:hypothetical protein [Actinomycetota bacterium]